MGFSQYISSNVRYDGEVEPWKIEYFVKSLGPQIVKNYSDKKWSILAVPNSGVPYAHALYDFATGRKSKVEFVEYESQTWVEFSARLIGDLNKHSFKKDLNDAVRKLGFYKKIKGRPTLVVDDVINSGRTFKTVDPIAKYISGEEVSWAVYRDKENLARWTLQR